MSLSFHLAALLFFTAAAVVAACGLWFLVVWFVGLAFLLTIDGAATAIVTAIEKK